MDYLRLPATYVRRKDKKERKINIYFLVVKEKSCCGPWNTSITVGKRVLLLPTLSLGGFSPGGVVKSHSCCWQQGFPFLSRSNHISYLVRANKLALADGPWCGEVPRARRLPLSFASHHARLFDDSPYTPIIIDAYYCLLAYAVCPHMHAHYHIIAYRFVVFVLDFEHRLASYAVCSHMHPHCSAEINYQYNLNRWGLMQCGLTCVR